MVKTLFGSAGGSISSADPGQDAQIALLAAGGGGGGGLPAGTNAQTVRYNGTTGVATSALTNDGTTVTVNAASGLAMATHKITGLGNGTAGQDAAAYGQLTAHTGDATVHWKTTGFGADYSFTNPTVGG